MSARAGAGIDAQIAPASTRLDWTKDRAAVDQTVQRVAEGEGRDVVQRHEVDPVELPVRSDRHVRNRQVVAGRQALLLRTVARVRLDVLAEQLAHEGGQQLVRGDRTRGRRWNGRAPRRRPPAGRRSGLRDRQRVADAEHGVAGILCAERGQPIEHARRGRRHSHPVSRGRPRRTGLEGRQRRWRPAHTARPSISRVSGLSAAAGSSVRSTTATRSRSRERLGERSGGEWPERRDGNSTDRLGHHGAGRRRRRGPCPAIVPMATRTSSASSQR